MADDLNLPEAGLGTDTLDPEQKVKALKAEKEARQLEYQTFGQLMDRMEKLYQVKLSQLDERVKTVDELIKRLTELADLWQGEVEIQMELTKVLGTQVTVLESNTDKKPIPLQSV